MYLIFDTETTGLPKRWDAPITDSDNWPRAVQIAWQLHDRHGKLIEHKDFLITPDDFNIPYDAEKVHGISTELAQQQGVSIQKVFEEFNEALKKSTYVVGQNIGFDINIMGAEFHRYGVDSPLVNMPVLDTCTEITAELCKIPGGRGGRYKLPTLTELHEFLFNVPFAEAHNATADVEATTRCFFELIRIGQGFETKDISAEYITEFQQYNPTEIQPIGLKHINLKKASEEIRKEIQKQSGSGLSEQELNANIALLEKAPFAHLHNHTQFSVLQATTSIQSLVKKTIQEKMSAVAMTDSGNMMGAFHFIKEVLGYNKSAKAKNDEAIEKGETPSEIEIKPIVGCEFNVCENHLDKSHQDNGYQVVMLAKNKNGYHNLAKMASIAYTDGYYYVPRIDKNIVEKYKENLIVLTGGMNGEVPSKVLNIGEKQAETALLWWKNLFGEDLYIELMRHNQEDENRVNQVLIELSKKHQVKLVATNNTFYINQKDANAHDILLCVKDGEKQATPIGRGRGYRFGMPNQEYYYKSAEQMKTLFKDVPEAILNIQEIIDKIEIYNLAREVLLPKFQIPDEFLVEDDPDGKKGENKYLRHLTYLGAEKRYELPLSEEVIERLDFELMIIEKTGYPGYFLIVQDFIAAAREMGVSVGPGRGSAAGSAVAYCLGITNIDPIKYDLLFERFLNPDRVSMPDIDIDFDDEGRSLVMDYVINKYGKNQVAQIITYGTMAAKSSIRDTARVLDLPLHESDRIAKLVPNMKLAKIFSMDDKQLKEKLRSDELPKVNELKQIAEGTDLAAETLQQAQVLEGSVRNTGIHACGVIITPDDITNFVPVSVAKDSDLFVTQFDNSVVESAGLLKMDFLGLKTLTLIKDSVELIKRRNGIEINPDEIPIDDKKTYELFQRGETVGIFQYESPGMQKYMRELKPTVFADLIAMNALYRPGPLEYIPSFIKRKHGTEPIVYDLDAMEEYLKETYGITVYQEQVMLLSQKLAGFSKGDADMLRKAMGKKIFALLEKLKPKFVEGGIKNGHPADILEKIWKDWEAFASYAFNKSHSTCYAWIAYQTAYLKANYPAEFMAAVLSNNMNDIKQVSFFLEECQRMGIKVLSPDVNESFYKFTVNKDGNIRFGMGAIKGVGKNAVETIVDSRKDGNYTSIFDVTRRVDFRNINKKAFENIALAGGFDSFTKVHRAQYFHDEGDGIVFLEKAIRYGNKYQENKNSPQMSLFGESSGVEIPEPTIPNCESWGNLEQLRREKEVVGIYISGHPLDDFKHSLDNFCNLSLTQLQDLSPLINREISIAGMITDVQHRTSKNGKGWASFILEDYEGSHEFRLFNDDYLKFRNYLILGTFLYCKFLVKEGWQKKDSNEKAEPRIQFTMMIQLQDVLASLAKKIALHLNIKDISTDLIENYKNIIEKHQGNYPITFIVHNMEENIHLNMDNGQLKVDISKEFLEELDQKSVSYVLNDRKMEKLITKKKEEVEEEEQLEVELIEEN
ncbi:DNA polymerase III subunit alpha [Capnocytophaga canimorsus]|uniref:DNA polymerase III subunit alpha n=1 Tax=Capnocytophaga canimorsus TaxID=28188 RepID=UPI000BB1E27E|nr:DNA polymerase III subunit alpha [Capnocytophaga canimorsus]ATA76279.1 DNA polymerase III subunit alpha [Capnocytophaga canimorsus]PJI77197.1 DNA polymerase-3 subunit alpha [Capnocytophaga canimorsus]STA71405.1 DNA polymerase III subunit alpha [Capnocytophaga canimorsus]